MSSFLYGRMQAKREEPTTRDASKQTEPPGLGTYADVLTALVPAEVLAAAVFFVSQYSTTKKGADGKTAVTITHHDQLKWAFYGCALAALLLYVAGHTKLFKDWSTWDPADTLRMLIPPLAFVGWSMAQTPSTMFDTAFSLSGATKTFLIVTAAFVLGGGAAVLGNVADKKNTG